MACNRGKAHPNLNTKLKLFSDSGGFCQNPACNLSLFPTDAKKHSHFAEMAHIFAATDGGPRSNPELTEEERGNYDNIILLCANCHTLIDKEPETFPDAHVTAWKRDHVGRLQGLFGVQEFCSRLVLRESIDQLLRENHAVHKSFGPDLDYQSNPEAPEAELWKSRVRSTIIPNSNRVILLLDKNSKLLTEEERSILEEFRIHVNGLISRHLNGEEQINPRFPEGMGNISVD